MASRKREVVWSPQAESDLQEVWEYLAREVSIELADRRVRQILDACDPLLRFPFRGRPRDELLPGLRSILSQPHVVFYRAARDHIEIVRILHGRRDIESIFGDDD
jgi:toxin ParE1/3/4